LSNGLKYFVSSDGHHHKKELKAHIEGKGVRVLTLSEVEVIEKDIEKT
jgi:hypothetical protein